MKKLSAIEIKCETKDFLKLEDMTVMQGNLKERNDTDYEKIKKSILTYSFSFPFFIWKDGKTNYLIDGTGRHSCLLRMQEEGYIIPDLPVVYVDCKDKNEAKQKLLRLNSQYGHMTKESVLDFAEGLDLNFDEIALPDSIIDFSNFLDNEEEETEGDDETPEVDEKSEPVSKRGEMYELGNSILMCGDSTSAEDVARLMGGEKADMVFTDPPYGMKKENEGVANDNLNFDDLLEFNKKWIPLSFEALKDNGSWYCWGIDEPLMDIYSNILKPMAKENKITFRNLITWDKGNGQGQLSEDFRMYPIADEKCLFVMCGVQGFDTTQDNYYEGFEPIRQYLNDELAKIGVKRGAQFEAILGSVNKSQSILSKSHFNLITEPDYRKLQEYASDRAFNREYEEIKKEYEEIKKEYYSTRAYFDNTHDNMNNVWHFARTGSEERIDTGGHATPKPIELCSRAINTSSRVGEFVLDLFGGSGSTLIACEKLGRKCRMLELEPKWCDVIRKRYTKWCKENGKPITSGCLDDEG